MTEPKITDTSTAVLSWANTSADGAPDPRSVLDLKHLVDRARQCSTWYAQLYRDLPAAGWQLEDLPVVEPCLYWQGNESLKSWPVLTGPMSDAIVFKTGATTGGGKYSVFSSDELRAFVTSFGRSIASQLQPGDRVANLFFAGDLYASFLFIHGALSQMSTPVCEYPFTGATEPEVLTAQIAQHGINVLAGVPGKLLHYAAALETQGLQIPEIETVLYGGESLFAGQLQLLGHVFPNARVASIGCASVDAGLIGASAPDCLPGEHRAFDPETIVEIIDEVSGEPIHDLNRPGLLVVTSLTRTLMPMIRYPVGDMAAWREAPGCANRKFMLLGRSTQGHRLRVGYVTLFPDAVARLIDDQVGQCDWQLLIDHQDGTDHIALRIAAPADPQCSAVLIDTLRQNEPAIVEQESQGQLKIAVQWCRQIDLLPSPRTGKLQRVLDRRAYAVQPAVAT